MTTGQELSQSQLVGSMNVKPGTLQTGLFLTLEQSEILFFDKHSGTFTCGIGVSAM